LPPRPRRRAARATRRGAEAWAPYTGAAGCTPISVLQSVRDDLLRHPPRARRRALRQDGRLLQGQPERDRHRRPPRGEGPPQAIRAAARGQRAADGTRPPPRPSWDFPGRRRAAEVARPASLARMATTTTQTFKNFIGGEWVDAASGETFEST